MPWSGNRGERAVLWIDQWKQVGPLATQYVPHLQKLESGFWSPAFTMIVWSSTVAGQDIY